MEDFLKNWVAESVASDINDSIPLALITTMNVFLRRGVIRISTQPRQKYKILTRRNNRFLHMLLINHTRLFHSGTAKMLSHFGWFHTKVQEAYNILIFFIFDGKQHPKNI